ncbi:pseudouridine synthase, RluA family [Alkaliphilus metalliredigens QYMF]|uniref:Pseudouridine synthase n=2 Tax=Alkaliphilus TaxID=114627 RepID=A6TSZ4_ALKMQ|nr:pseudouridine synthase, RluA family [Alkaliphilus metalliredigens QYMF]
MLVPNEQNERMITYEVEAEDDQQPLKETLKNRLDLSSRLLTKLKKSKRILINGQYAKYHELLSEGDWIKIDMTEEASQFEPQEIPFNVVYEDIDVIVINKEPGIVSHPTKSHPKDTIANAAQNYLEKKGVACRIRFVNRLDMDTSGLLVIAKNPYTHHIMSQQMKANEITKKYVAFVKGVVVANEGEIDGAIYRSSDETIKRVVDDRGQQSLTKFTVLERYADATMLEVSLLTGRTHQIRVHMESIGHPMLGDHLYGYVDTELIRRQALHASYLSFLQPRYKEKIEVRASLPKDLNELRNKLKDELLR